MAKFFILFLLFFGIVSGSDTALEKRIKISETAVVGQRVGWAVEPIPENVDRANFYFVFPEGESRAEKVSWMEFYNNLRLSGTYSVQNSILVPEFWVK
jgi:hypothetical protein